MVTLLSLNNSLSAIAEQLSADFKCSKKAIYADYERRKEWIPEVEAMDFYATKMQARLDFLDREAVSMITSIANSDPVKNRFLKLGAINAAAKITHEQIALAQEQGYIEKRPIAIVECPTGLPFERDSDIKKILLAEMERQKEQRRLEDERRATDALESREAEPKTGN
ncbi:MAG: hypothetical protein PHI29_13205 [Gallionella sp.]|nr:hypothetical protein [Gallionella sp.]